LYQVLGYAVVKAEGRKCLKMATKFKKLQKPKKERKKEKEKEQCSHKKLQLFCQRYVTLDWRLCSSQDHEQNGVQQK
jgi:hypothetical protein